jgi:amidase
VELSEYAAADATELATLIRRDELKPEEVVDAAREAITSVDAQLNAVVGGLFDEPLDADADGPFAGVPFAIKDLVLHAAGVPVEFGSRMLAGFAFPHDTELMARFRRAGLAAMCRTTAPEIGYNATTEAVANGPTHNPWALGHSPGGSSGGSAALVAAGALPVAHANDGGGSIRIPAAQCGLVGLKPSRGRVPLGPDFDAPLAGMGIEFAVTRTVRDCAAILDAVAGHLPGELFHVPPPARPYAEEVGARIEPHRVALQTVADNGAAVDPEAAAAARHVAELLAGEGHAVEDGGPEIDPETLFSVNLVQWTAFAAEVVDDLAEALGATPSAEVLEHATLACVEHGRGLSGVDVLHSEAGRNQLSRTVAGFFQGHDLLITPTTARPAWRHGELDQNDPTHDAVSWTTQVFEFAPFTSLFNVTGNPAISLPLGQTSDGLPLGVQIVAAWGREDLLLRIASFLEQAMPWSRRVPSLHVTQTP